MSTENNQLPQQYQDTSNNTLIFDVSRMDAMLQMADTMSTAKATVPEHLKGSPGDCLAIVMQSAQWHMNPYAVAQKTHLINGALGYEAQLVNAVVSSSSLLARRISYAFEGDWTNINGKSSNSESHAVTVSATIRGESTPKSLRVAMSQVGNVRNSPLWTADPRQQLAYLATKKWARLNAPDVLLGVYTPDELIEIAHAEMDMGDATVVHLADIGANKQSQDSDPPALAEIISAINDANNMVDLRAVSSKAALLADGKDKDTALAAWQARRQAIEDQASTDTADVTRIIVVAAAELIDRIAEAQNDDDLDVIEDMARSMDDAAERNAVGAGIKKRRREISQ